MSTLPPPTNKYLQVPHLVSRFGRLSHKQLVLSVGLADALPKLMGGLFCDFFRLFHLCKMLGGERGGLVLVLLTLTNDKRQGADGPLRTSQLYLFQGGRRSVDGAFMQR